MIRLEKKSWFQKFVTQLVSNFVQHWFEIPGIAFCRLKIWKHVRRPSASFIMFVCFVFCFQFFWSVHWFYHKKIFIFQLCVLRVTTSKQCRILCCFCILTLRHLKCKGNHFDNYPSWFLNQVKQQRKYWHWWMPN